MRYVQGVYECGHNALMIFEFGWFDDGVVDPIQYVAAYLEPKWDVQIVTRY